MRKILKFLLIFALGVFASFGILQIFDHNVINLWNFRSDGLVGLFGIGLYGFIALKGANGAGILGSKDLRLGPCNVYARTEIQPLQSGTVSNLSTALTGTVAVAPIAGTTTSTVTGTSTTFIADLVKNQMVLIGTSDTAKVIKIISNTSVIIDKTLTVSSGASIKKALTAVTGTGTSFLTTLKQGRGITYDGLTFGEIIEITDDTNLVLKDPSVLLDSVAYRAFNAILIGGTDATTLKFSTKKAELKKSQGGESAANRVVTGAECSIEVGMVETSLQRLEATLQGLVTKMNTSGEYTGYGLGLSLGESDLDIAYQVTLVRIKGGVESTDPNDTMHFPLCAPQTDAEFKWDVATQLNVKTMFNVYRSPDVTYNGLELFGYAGDLVT
jgi:hypothetical protein